MQYVPIRVSTLRGDQKIEFDAFLKINGKLVLYLRRGDSFEGTRLNRLKEKRLRQMFIGVDDELNYRTYLSRNMDLAYNKNSGSPLENRAQIVQGIQQSNIEEVMENPDHAELYGGAKDGALKYVEFILGEDQAFACMMGIENVDQNIVHHGVAVSTLAIALAKRLEMQDPKDLQLLTLGALLHDFGHFQSPLAINRPLKDFTPEELAVYKNHPFVGWQKVQEIKHFDASVVNIINQHEEFVDGNGFPQGLTQKKMDPLAVIVASCNALDRLITFEGVKKEEAVKQLILTGVGKYPLNHLQLLGDIMKSMRP